MYPPLKKVMKQTSTYLRRRMPNECFECLNILNQILTLDTHPNQTALGHYPSASMFASLIQTFGEVVPYDQSVKLRTPVFDDDEEDKEAKTVAAAAEEGVSDRDAGGGGGKWKTFKLEDGMLPTQKRHVRQAGLTPGILSRIAKVRATKRVDNDNKEFDAWMAWRKVHEFNFVDSYAKERYNHTPQPRPRTRTTHIHNYSIQELSSTVEQLAQLRARMVKENPHCLLAYGTTVLSQTVPMVDVAEEMKRVEFEERGRRVTVEGFWSG
ncbi:hypothetical protein HK104_003663 [Borealophlyctis nickersoniae]|nr:hypothetical protein HK104_003663 [Borealophlyctis nickersoniae]